MKLLNQSGMSIVQGMLLAAIIAGSALVVTKLMTDQKSAMKSAETRDQIEQLHNMIFGMLQNREHCTATIAQNGLNAPNAYVLGGGSNMTAGIWAKNATVTPAFRITDNTPDTTYMNNNVTIKAMRMIYPVAPDNLAAPATLRITYNRLEGLTNGSRTKNAVGAKSINRDISILMQFTGTGPATIRSCYAVQALRNDGPGQPKTVNEEFCKSFGVGGSLFVWDPNTNTCTMKNNVCGNGFIFEGIDSNGNAICRTIGFYLNFLLDPTAAPCIPPFTNVRFVMGPNGLRIQCN